MKWIKASVRAGNVRFSLHVSADSFRDHNVSPDEAVEAILLGRPIMWEPGTIPKTHEPTMNMRCERKLSSRSITVVVAITDDADDVIVVTVWDKKLK